MLIVMGRDYFKGYVAHGWCGAMYWRAIAVIGGITSPNTRSNSVYIQVLVPMKPSWLDQDWDGAFQAPHNTHVAKTVSAYVPGEDDGGLPDHMAMQWVECSYGTVRTSLSSGEVVNADINTAWYPRKRGSLAVPVLRETFRKYIQPTAKYMCSQLTRLLQNANREQEESEDFTETLTYTRGGLGAD